MNPPIFRPVVTDRRPIWQSNLLQTGPVLNVRPPSYRSKQSRTVSLYRCAVGRPVGSQGGCTVDMVMTERVRGHQHSRDPFQAGVQ